jgi:hypothetical protein
MSWTERILEGVQDLGTDIGGLEERIIALERWRGEVAQEYAQYAQHEDSDSPALDDDGGPGMVLPIDTTPAVRDQRTAPSHNATPKEREGAPAATDNPQLSTVNCEGTDLSQLDAPEPPPLTDTGVGSDHRRSPAEMVEAILSNLTLCIDADGVPKAVVKRLLEAQRWALILKKTL